MLPLRAGHLKREGPAPKAAFVGEPKESGLFAKIVLEGPQPTRAAKPEAEHASAGRRDDPEAVPARRRDRTEGRTRIPDWGCRTGESGLTVTRAGIRYQAWASATGPSPCECGKPNGNAACGMT